jgi:hypothetical protein
VNWLTACPVLPEYLGDMCVDEMSIMEAGAVRKSGMFGKWHPVLWGMAVILSIVILACLVSRDNCVSSSILAPIEKSPAERSVPDANRRFDERVRATEAGFNAAFPFHR